MTPRKIFGKEKESHFGTIQNTGHTSELSQSGSPQGMWIPKRFRLSVFTGKEGSGSPRPILQQKPCRCWPLRSPRARPRAGKSPQGCGWSSAGIASPSCLHPVMREVISPAVGSRTKNPCGEQDTWKHFQKDKKEWAKLSYEGDTHRKWHTDTQKLLINHLALQGKTMGSNQ